MIEHIIHEKLANSINCFKLDITNQSHKHAKHFANKILPELKQDTKNQLLDESPGYNVTNKETHFELLVVSDDFSNISVLNRHKMIYSLLSDELNGPVHSLSICAKTVSEWKSSAKDVGAFSRDNPQRA